MRLARLQSFSGPRELRLAPRWETVERRAHIVMREKSWQFRLELQGCEGRSQAKSGEGCEDEGNNRSKTVRCLPLSMSGLGGCELGPKGGKYECKTQCTTHQSDIMRTATRSPNASTSQTEAHARAYYQHEAD